MSLGVGDFIFPGFQIPCTPGGDDLHLRSKGFDGQFKPHLVVAFAGAAVGYGVRALFFGDLHQPFGDDGARKRGSQQVLILVHGAGLDGGNDEFIDEFLAQIFYVQLGGAGFNGLFLQPAEFLALPNVGCYRNNLAVIVILFQPRDNNRRIQTAGIGQHDFFNLFHIESASFPVVHVLYYITVSIICNSKFRIFMLGRTICQSA